MSCHVIRSEESKNGALMTASAIIKDDLKLNRGNRLYAWMEMLGLCVDRKHNTCNSISPSTILYSCANLPGEDIEDDRAGSTINLKVCNPLSKSPENPWTKQYRQQEKIKEIENDVHRLHYDSNDWFTMETNRRMITDLLCKWTRYRNVEYRQGMSDIAAIVLYVAHVSLHGKSLEFDHAVGGTNGYDAQVCMHIGYSIFDKIMWTFKHKDLFENGIGSPSGSNRIEEIMETLRDISVDIYLKLVTLNPAVFMLRWLRLLFSREFNVESTVALWDRIFAYSVLGIAPETRKLIQGENDTKKTLCAFSGPQKASDVITESKPSRVRNESRLWVVDIFAVSLLLSLKESILSSENDECFRILVGGIDHHDVYSLLERANSLCISIHPIYARWEPVDYSVKLLEASFSLIGQSLSGKGTQVSDRSRDESVTIELKTLDKWKGDLLELSSRLNTQSKEGLTTKDMVASIIKEMDLFLGN